MEVAILIFDGVDELDAIGPYEVLSNAAQLGADLCVRLLVVRPTSEVTGNHGLRIRPDSRLRAGGCLDLVVVPGGGWNDRSEKGTWAETQRKDLPEAIARLHKGGTTVASVCTGGMLVSAAGLTKGRPATTHHEALEELREQGAEVVEARVVDDGDLLSSGSVTSGIDLALWLVEREWGADLTKKIAAEMEYERRGEVYRRNATPAPERQPS
ncbi:MAG: DJ-1/PfpI family protein [Rubrobacteraceae bacterium]